MSDDSELERVRLAQALTWHLAYNFIPPYPAWFFEPCLEAVDACNAGNSEKVITLPGGLTVTAGKLIDDLKLNDLIEA